MAKAILNFHFDYLTTSLSATGCTMKFQSLGKFKYTRHLLGNLRDISFGSLRTNQRCETLYLFCLPSYSGGLHHRCSHLRNEQSQRPGAAQLNMKICQKAKFMKKFHFLGIFPLILSTYVLIVLNVRSYVYNGTFDLFSFLRFSFSSLTLWNSWDKKYIVSKC